MSVTLRKWLPSNIQLTYLTVDVRRAIFRLGCATFALHVICLSCRMSRLIVKNLPKTVSSDNLNKIFSEKGEVTDVQLKYTKDGKFRHFAFVGFRTDEQAKDAKEYFDGTYIKSNKVNVEVCAALGDSNKPKAWSKYASDSEAYKKIHGLIMKTLKPENTEDISEKKNKKEAKLKKLLREHINDPLFVDFLEAHSGKSTIVKEVLEEANKLQNNNDQEEEDDNDYKNAEKEDNEDKIEKDNVVSESDKSKKKANENIRDREYMKLLKKNKTSVDTGDGVETAASKKVRNRQLYYIKMNGLPFKSKKKDVKDFFRPLIPYTVRIPRSKKRGFCYVGFREEEELKKAILKNGMFLTGNKVHVFEYVKKDQIDEDEATDSKYQNFKSKEEILQNEESIAESGSIFARNLPYITTEDEIQKLFEKYGPVAEIDMPIDKISRKPKGFALITFMMPEHAVAAYAELDGSIYSGRMLHLLPGKQKQKVEEDEEGLSFKEKRARQLKNQAKSSHNWNTLFLGANAIADVVADTYNTTKEQLLHDNDKSSSAAVRLALGETHLVSETRKFLEKNGVYLDAFSRPPNKRSKTIILVKNLPANTNADEIRALFQPKGEIARIVMPPHGITVLVEFVEPSEARHAFVKLAYSQFKNLPLYLEWAPDNVFSRPASNNEKLPKTDEITPSQQITEESSDEKEEKKEEEIDSVEMSDPEPETVLFIKNLNFQTVEESIKEHFKNCGPIFKITIAKKKDPQNPGKLLSMGYGFIQFYTKKITEKVLKEKQSSTLDGKTIELKRSERTGLGDVKTNKKSSNATKQTGSKILVRNVPFQAKREEIHEIFRTFGEIKTLRLPKKLSPGEDRHRGFCFVDFYSNADAKSAFEALCHSTHLYGRRLILEWASQSDEAEDVDKLRKRTADTYNQGAPGGKKSMKSVIELETLVKDDE